MNTVVLEVRSLTETLTDAAHIMNTGRAEHEAHIGFATPELLWQVLTALLSGKSGSSSLLDTAMGLDPLG